MSRQEDDSDQIVISIKIKDEDTILYHFQKPCSLNFIILLKFK